MTLTIENNVKEFVFDYIKSAILTFEDGTEIKLSQVTDIDIDLNRLSQSYIYVTSAVQDSELENCYSKDKRITHVHLEPVSVEIKEGKDIESFYDISCNMKINRLRFGRTRSNCGDMYFELEGWAM